MAANRRSRIFVSYAREDDEPFVLRLVADLRTHGLHVWWDRDTMSSRGRSFPQELRDAIWNADRVIAVIAPAALRSAYVRTEWEHALLFSRAVIPILRQGELGAIPEHLARRSARLLPHLHTPDFSDDASYPQALNELVRLLRERIPRAGRPLGVPSLPPHFMPRLQTVEEIENGLLADAVGPDVVAGDQRIAALVGIGGSGKSTLAAAFCRDVLAQRAFDHGIVWLPVGQEPDLLAVMNRLGGALRRPASPYADDARARDDLTGALATRVMLIVLDDVWKLEHVEPFVAMLGPRCRLLLTTRDAALATARGARTHRAAELDESEALSLLASWAGCEAADLPEDARRVAVACGRLPFALALCGGMARTGTSWTDILQALEEVDLSFIELQLPHYPHKDLLRALAVGVEFLAREDPGAAERYREMAVLPRDVAVRESALAKLWSSELSARHARQLLTKLANSSLLHLEGHAPNRLVTLHTLQHDYVVALKPDLARLHMRMLDAYGAACAGHWAKGGDDGYFFQHLLFHLDGAGRRTTVDALLVDPEWLRAKLAATDVASLLADFRDVSPDHVAGLAVRDALRLSAYRVAEDASLLIGQLVGRLLSSTSPSITGAVDTLKSYHGEAWLRPGTPQLIPVGGPLHRMLTRGPNVISSMAVSADGSTAITAASFDKDLKVWDLRAGALVRVLPEAREHAVMELSGPRVPADALAISPDGRRAVSALARPDVTVWGVTSGQSLRSMREHGDNVASAVWRDDGLIVSVDRRGEILVWDPESLRIERRYPESGSWMISPDGRAVVLRNGTVLDVDSGAVTVRLQAFLAETLSTALSADGRVLLCIQRDGTARWWDLSTGVLAGEVPKLAPSSACAVLSRDGREAVIGWGAMVATWDVGAPQLRSVHRAHVETCAVAALTNDERWLLSASHELAVWDLEAIRRDAGPLALPASVMRTAVSNRCYAAGLSSGALVVWDRENGSELHRASYPTERPADGYAALTFSRDSNRIVMATTEGLVAVRDLREWERETRYEKGFVVALLPSANRVVTYGKPSLKELTVWDVESGESSCTIAGYVSHRPQAFTPDGRLAALVGEKEQIRIVALDDGRLLHETAPRAVTSLIAAPDNRHIIIGDAGAKQLSVLDLASGRIVVTVAHEVGHTSDAWAMTHEGTTLMAANNEGLIRAWDVNTGTQRYELRPHASYVDRILVTADDRRAVSFGSYDGLVQVWDVASGTPVARFVAEGYVSDGHVSPDGRTLVAGGVGEPLVLHLEEKAAGR